MSLRHLEKNELLVVLSSLSENNFVILDRITDESAHKILSRILGEKNNEWWLYLKKHKYILKFLEIYPIYDIFNNNYPQNVIHFIHDYLDYDFIADFIDGYLNFCITDNDANLFRELYNNYEITMNEKEKKFNKWLMLPLEKRELTDEILSYWGVL